ncbi:MAG: 50S ribosomal protein L11 [Candidatus Nanoarchaeia archaeon]|nr:50S ribosomal protein L11 [Candidatus Nanoarchaeia archaeon]
MSKEKVDVLIEGGKATAAPPLGPALGSYKVNIKGIVDDINKKTQAFKGMKVPVTVTVDTETKEYDIKIGTPPVSQLIKKELNLQKGAGIVHLDKIANISIEQCIKVAKMKQDSMLVRDLRSAVKSVIGSCGAMGILIEGKSAVEINEDVDNGKFDKEIREGKEIHSPEKSKRLEDELSKFKTRMAPELDKIKAKEKKATEEAAAKTTEGEKTPEAAAPAAKAAPKATPKSKGKEE